MGADFGKFLNKGLEALSESGKKLGEQVRIGAEAVSQRVDAAEWMVIEMLLEAYPKKKGNKAYVAGLKELQEAGVEITTYFIIGLALEKGSDKKYVGGLKELKAAGFKLDKFFTTYLSLEKGRDKNYVDGLKELKTAGFLIEEYLIEALSLEKGRDKKYVSFLKGVKALGVGLSSSYIREFSLEKGRDNKYLGVLIELKAAGIEVDGQFILDFSLKKGRSKEYVDVLKELRAIGIGIDDDFVEYFSLEKGLNRKYVDVLKELKAIGIGIDAFFVDILSVEKARDKTYMAELKGLHEIGLEINGGFVRYFPLGKGRSKDYVGGVKELKSAGFNINEDFVRWLKFDKGTSREYIDVLKGLKAIGFKIEWAFVRGLSFEKVRNKDYLDGLRELKALGLELSPAHLPLEKGRSRAYIDGLKKLNALGFKIDWVFVDSFSLAKARDEGYLDVLKELKDLGFDIDGFFVDGFSLEKSRSRTYLDVLKEFKAIGVELYAGSLTMEKGTSREYLDGLRELQATGFKIDEVFVRFLTMEKGISKEYLNGLQELNKGGRDVDGWFVKYLTFERGADAEYIKLLKKGEEMGYKIDRLYLKSVVGVEDSDIKILFSGEPEEAVDIAYRLKGELREKGKLTVVAEQIIDEMLEEAILPYIRTINDLHNESTRRRQGEIEDLPLEAMYALVVYGVEELFTSSFRSVVYPVLMKKMREAGMDAVDFIKHSDSAGREFRILLQVFAKFKKMGEFLATVRDKEKKSAFLKDYVFGLDAKVDGLKNGIAMAETFGVLKDKKLLVEVEGYLKDAYVQADGGEEILYGIIASVHEYNSRTEKEFFAMAHEKYPIKRMSRIDHEELVNKDNEIIQRYFFYNDEDGKSSFNNMVALYEGSDGWEMKDKGSYIVFSKRRGGVVVLKYANKPVDVEVANGEIDKVLKEKDLSAIEIVHRGHSYHVGDTLPHIPAQAKVVYLGSCGGFDNVRNVLKKAEGAHIIATKGTGTKFVNDPLLKILDETMLKGKGVGWNELWKRAERKLKWNKDWSAYVNPAKNMSVQFINAYEKYRKQ